MAERPPSYVAPVVKDYGDVWQITASVHPVLGSVAQGDLGFSSPAYPKAPGSGVGPGISTPQAGHGAPQLASHNVGGSVTGSNPAGTGTPGAGTAGVAHGGSGSGGTHGAGGSSPGGGTGGGGGTLPFTGLAVGALAAVGSGFAAAGGALRRAVRGRR